VERPVRRRPAGGRRKPVLERLLGRFPELATRLSGASPASAAAGTGPLEQRVRRGVAGNLALVGDAAGYLDAITGEGLAIAFAEAEALAAALAEDRLAGYERARRRIVRRPEILTRLALVLSRHPALRRRVLHRLAREPSLFDRLLALHVGALRGGELRLAAGLLARLLAPVR
jgi:menaquinone-9 beta-reductase